MKMYILIRDDIPEKFAPVISAHASLACYLKYEDNSDMQKWVNGIFKKVVCKVSGEEFENAKKFSNLHLIITESALDNREVAIVFVPSDEFPKAFKFYKLWSPKKYIRNVEETKVMDFPYPPEPDL